MELEDTILKWALENQIELSELPRFSGTLQNLLDSVRQLNAKTMSMMENQGT